MEHFSTLASNYDAIMSRVGYPDPVLIADMVTRIMSSKGLNPETAKVIDFGCGTGLVGQKLSELGFKSITGLDCSGAMLHEANEKKVYTHLE